MFGQIFALTILKAKVDVIGSLEGEMEVDDKGVVDLLENVYLSYHEFGLFAENYLLLLEYFQSI